MKRIIRSGIVLTHHGGGLMQEPRDLLVEEGRITAISPPGSLAVDDTTTVIDAEGGLVIPGLINTHTHSYANWTRGVTENIPLEPWMLYAIAEGAERTPEEVYLCALLGCVELLRTGTTLVLDHLAQDLPRVESAIQAYQEAGLRVAMAPMMTDRRYVDTIPLDPGDCPEDVEQRLASLPVRPLDQLVEEMEALIQHWQGQEAWVQILVGPSGPQRSSDAFLLALGELASRYDLRIHTHLLETKLQAQMAYRLWGKSMVRHLDDLGLLGPRFFGAHAIWLTDDDVELLGARGAGMVHNPGCNLIIGSGVSPLRKMLDAGVQVGLGTDGVNCGGTLSLFESMRLATNLHKVSDPEPDRWPTAAEAFDLATRGGARLLGREAELGSIEVGKRADLVILEANETYTPLNNPVRQLVYGERGHSIKTVLIDGRVVVEDGRITTIDVPALLDEVRDRAVSWRKRAAQAFQTADELHPYLLNMYRRCMREAAEPHGD